MTGPAFLLLLLLILPFIAIPIGAVAGLVRCVRHRRRPAVVTLVLLGVGGLGLLCLAILFALESLGNLYFYMWGAGSYHWKFYLELVTVPLLCFGGLFLSMDRILSWKTLLCGLLLVLSLFFFFCVRLFVGADASYTEITSPARAGETHQLLFEEKSYFMAGTGTVYEKVSPHFMKKLGDYVLDDGITYVHDGFCWFEWREDGFTIHYQFEAKFTYLSDRQGRRSSP